MSRSSIGPGFLAALLWVGIAAAASARPLLLTVAPSPPTWADPVVLTVDAVACPSVALAPTVDAAHRTIDVDLSDPCGGAEPAAQKVKSALGRLDEGAWTLTVHDRTQGGVTTLGFVVADLFDLDVILPHLATDAVPTILTVPTTEHCPYFDWRVAGKVIDIFLGDDICDFVVPPPPEVFDLQADLGVLPAGDYEVRLWAVLGNGEPVEDPTRVRRASLRVWNADGCVPGDTALCLQGGRFRVEATWRDFAGNSGVAHSTPLPGSDQSGLLWFFAPDNSELTLKVLSGCGVNDKWWAFVSSSSTVEYDVVITDTVTGARRTYHHVAGEAAALLADTAAFPCS